MLSVAFTYAQTAEEIVQKHIDAIGGAEALKKVNTVVMLGSMNVMGRDIELSMTQAHNKGSRTDINVAGMNNYELVTPTYGYRFFPVQGQTKPEPMTADELKESTDDLDIQGNLLDFASKGHSVEYLGTEDLEGTEVHKVRLTRKTSGAQTYYIDPASYYIVRVVTKRKMNGQEMDLSTDMSDYKDVNGLKMPHSISQPFGTLVIKSIKVNEPVDESIFAAPK